MRRETITVHGYDPEAAHKAVAVQSTRPWHTHSISAEHGAVSSIWEVEGFRYSRISNPTNAVLEKRVAALEGGVGALSVGSGQAALNYAILNVTEMGSNIVSVPQLYGTTSTLFSHTLPRLGVTAKLSKGRSTRKYRGADR